MKRIPAGILLATLALTSPILSRLHAEESAQQLSNQEFGTPAPSTQDESASQLSNQDLGPAPTTQDQSAQQLSNQDLGPAAGTQDESASQLSNQDLGPDQKLQDESARKLAEKEKLEKKSKVAAAPASAFGTGEGVDGAIYAAVAQADGSVIVGGRFENVNGQPRLNLARFQPDGTLDPTFLAGPTDGVDGTVRALALDAQGNLLVGGTFATAQDQPLQNFVRYLATGKVDTGFAGGQWPNGSVFAITVQPKGQIVIGGEFTQIGSAPRRNLARFKADGTLDGPVVSADSTTGAVRSLVSLPGGGVLAGGALEIAGQTARNLLVAP